MRLKMLAALALLVGGCATVPQYGRNVAPVEVAILAFNDFHGALEPPRQAVALTTGGGETVRVPAGGAAYLASAIASLRRIHPNSVTVSAGDLVGGSSLVSSQFLDEPTIHAMNLIGLDFNAVGNHEFDRGRAELLRLQNGGCERHTALQPCRIDADFAGARFGFLAANVVTEAGTPLFPPYGLRRFGSGSRQVTVAFIGMTLTETPTIVDPAGIAGLSFRDEADTVNALIPQLRREGADAIVVLIHQGLATDVGYNDKSCGGISGDLLPILARLDSEVDLVVSGHTHNAYVCDYARIDPTRPFLVTSAGRSGTLLTNAVLSVDPARSEVVARRADNIIVQSEPYAGGGGQMALTTLVPAYPPDQAVATLVGRYAAAAAPLAARIVGRLTAPALDHGDAHGENVLCNLIADAHLAATRRPEAGGAQLAFTNSYGVRADLVPAADGSVTFGQIYAAQPFANSLMVKTMTGRQIRAVLEQQWASGRNTVEQPNMLCPSNGFTYRYDLSRPAGQRVIDPRLNGEPLRDEGRYRVAMNNFIANGGDNFTMFREGDDPVGGPQDVDALEAYLTAAGRLSPPSGGRVINLRVPPAAQ